MKKSLFSAFLLLCTTAFGQGQFGKYPKPNEGRANAKQITTVKTMSDSPFYGERKFKVANDNLVSIVEMLSVDSRLKRIPLYDISLRD